MVLIRENKQKKRKVFLLNNGKYKKVWSFCDRSWLTNHVNILRSIMPGYVAEYGFNKEYMFLVLNELPGTPVSQLIHTPKLIKQVYDFCLLNLKETSPYVHADWVLSNILHDNGTFRLCDWDNVNTSYPKSQVFKKLHKDLASGFGDKFYEVINYDPKSI